ncbi:SDR family NAD(P)-dependent oxidoreductase [Nocardia brasiliensis]|uniref:SDR family NAD(P)-dependent oxidoreductase n=1 Tax=Nocardia brasiliensis TaxID=37326 RepID=UPI0037B438BD
MELGLHDKVAVVTGASKGIGLATARTLHAEGASVIAVSRHSTSELDALAGERLVHVAADLSTPDGPAQAIAAAERVFGGLDVLVNNAGGPPPGAVLPRFTFTELTDSDWTAMLNFNLMSTVRAVRAAIPLLLERGGGSIVNVTSTHALVSSAVNADYGAAIAALLPCMVGNGRALAPGCPELLPDLHREQERIDNQVADLLAARAVLDAIVAATVPAEIDESDTCRAS